MKVAIKDANIIFGLMAADLLERFYALDLEVWTTDLVIAEIEKPDQNKIIKKHIDSNNLHIYNLSSDELSYIYELSSERSLSVPDISIYLLAQNKKAILLSGDKALRTYAASRGLEVKGMLWIFDELIAHGLIEPKEACTKLEYIAAHNTRLPPDEVDKRLKKWLDL